MLKYVMMAGVVAAALTAGSSGAYAKNGSTFFANQPKGCHRVLSDLKVVNAIWVGCKFKWWGGAFEPGDANGGSWYATESKDPCRPRCKPPCEKVFSFRKPKVA